MATYKTPGVYVEEIPKFPPSVAQVETAIPAFVGYTEKAFDENGAITKPKKVESLLEFELYFGAAPAVKVNEIIIGSDNVFKSADIKVERKLYDSVRLFYANGGGPCYIVSAGDFSLTPGKAHFLAALAKLEKEDEPTMLVFPDNALLSTADACEVYQQALIQCQKLQDRITIMDVDPKADTGTGVQTFRDTIGTTALKYGVANTPFVKAALPKKVRYADLVGKVKIGTTVINDFKNLTNDVTAKANVVALDKLLADVGTIEAATGTITTSTYKTLSDRFEVLKQDLKQATTDNDVVDKLKTIFLNTYKVAAKVDSFVAGTPLLSSGLVTFANSAITSRLSALYLNLVKYENLAKANVTEVAAVWEIAVTGTPSTSGSLKIYVGGTLIADATPSAATVAGLRSAISQEFTTRGNSYVAGGTGNNPITITAPAGVGSAGNNLTIEPTNLVATLALSQTTVGVSLATGFLSPLYPSQISTGFPTTPATIWGSPTPFASVDLPATDNFTYPADYKTKAGYLLSKIDPLIGEIIQLYNSIHNEAVSAVDNKEFELVNSFPVLKSIIAGANSTPIDLPPCGPVAGIYAQVDSTRGVWKAPANVSVSGIVGVTEQFSSSELDGLNVDVTGGKSINVIRFFTGKGLLLFGARTLAGNDNEWRYVSVRRFFNMVEESCKKATEQFVFEANDSNTWIRVQGMIENFLTLQWRAGALQGAKPEQAFYVAVGLGKTMTAVDVLEGRLIVEIGMAVVRPAEFIILRFSHKLPEA